MSATARSSIGAKLCFAAVTAIALIAPSSYASASSPDGTVVEGRGQSVVEATGQQLTDGQELVHPVVAVRWPKLGEIGVALYRQDKDSTNISGVVLVPDRAARGRWLVTSLPSMTVADGLFDIEVSAVLGADAAGGTRLLVLLYRQYRLGSGDEAALLGAVYTWDGTRWSRDDGRSARLRGVGTAVKARTVLK